MGGVSQRLEANCVNVAHIDATGGLVEEMLMLPVWLRSC
jgi:hypothetical protein